MVHTTRAARRRRTAHAAPATSTGPAGSGTGVNATRTSLPEKLTDPLMIGTSPPATANADNGSDVRFVPAPVKTVHVYCVAPDVSSPAPFITLIVRTADPFRVTVPGRFNWVLPDDPPVISTVESLNVNP